MMELFIETLTGTAFELRVSPFETIMSVKAKIQRLEGIPISQQHLIWQSVELEDDYCLHDYSIHDGATLKLVLAMRGGPINTRRIPMEDPALREMAEYVEANRDEIWEKLPGNRQVTLLVFREGDQLNFFRVVDRGDGTLTPLSESLSGASIYNFNDEDEEDEVPSKEKVEENVRMREKMKQLRRNMEKLSVTKKPEKEVKPVMPTRSNSTQGKSRYFTGTGLVREKTTLNKIPCLPPLGQKLTSQLSKEERASSSETEELNFKSSDEETSSPDHTLTGMADPIGTAKSCLTVADLAEPGPSLLDHAQHTEIPTLGEVEVNSRHSVISPGKLSGLNRMTDTTSVPISSSSRRRELTVDSIKETFRPPTSSKARERKKELSYENLKDVFSRPTTSARKDTTLGSLKETLGRSSSKYGLLDRRKEFTLESLSSSEARAMSGLLRQASLERIGSSRIGNFVTSASKSRIGNYHVGTNGRIPTPDGRIVSGRLRMSANRDGRLLSPTHRLPPVKTKKKVVKRCYVCAKKTGLATSYQCRCGNNFCASHRYAESHDCTYDYKTEGRKLLEQSNPVVSAPKLPKI